MHRRKVVESMGMRNCCKDFFGIEGLQGILNIPMQFCPYCGHKLTDKEFAYYNKRLGKVNPQKILESGIKAYLWAIKIRARKKCAMTKI